MTDTETGQVGPPGNPDGQKSFKESKHRSQLTYLTKKQKEQVAEIVRVLMNLYLQEVMPGLIENAVDERLKNDNNKPNKGDK